MRPPILSGECDLSCVDRFNLQRYFTGRLWTGPNIYFASVIAHADQTGNNDQEILEQLFLKCHALLLCICIENVIVVHVIHDPVSNSIMCSRNHDPIPCCGHDFTHEMVTEFQRWPGFPSHTSLLCHYKHRRRCPDHHSD